MTLSEKQRRFTIMVADLIRWAYENNMELTFGEAYRTRDQQKIYIEQGKSKTMKSKHLTRLAVDLNLFIDGQYQRSTEAYRILGEAWESLDPNNKWGGRWGWDGNHFEYDA